MAFTQITVTASFTRPDGTPAQGTITATLSETIQNGTAIIEPTPIAAALSHSGTLVNQSGLPLTLAANDDTATLPAGSHYTFLLELDNSPTREFQAVIPHAAAAGTIDLSVLEPTTP